MEKEKPAYHDNLIEYLGNPFDHRTQKQFADDNGIDDSTVYRYRQLHSAELEEGISRSKKRYLEMIRREAYKSLAKRISKSDNALKMALQIVGDLVERTESRIEHDYKTPEQKREKVKQLLASIEEKANKEQNKA